MSSRERVTAALEHREADRVPIDLGGFQTGIHKKAYEALVDYLGMAEEIATLDPVQQLARPSEEVLERFRVDVRYVCAHGPEGFDGTIKRNERNGRVWYDLTDEFGVVWSMAADGGLYMDISHHPLEQAGVRDLDDYPFPDGGDVSRFTGVREEAIRLRKETGYAISTGIGGVVYEYCWYMRGLERWFMDMIEGREFCEALLNKMVEFWMDYYRGFMQAVGDVVDVVMIGDDLAGQDGPLFSPEFYRSVVKPRQKRLVQHIRSLTDAKIWYHTCGGCVEYIDDLIDNGVDILNPIQISARGMDARELKRRYGDRIVFWGGGIDSQHILPFVGPEQVREEVRKNLEIFKSGGGYVFNNVHNIQAGVPAENIVALYEAAVEFGGYD